MKICFIGLGSIGKRHLNNLVQALKVRKINYVIDAVRSTKQPLEQDIEDVIHESFSSIDQLDSTYDIIFITNPTFKHYETLNQVIGKTKHIFLEKPIFSNLDIDLKQFICKPDSVYYVACPLRYHPVVEYVKQYSLIHKVIAVRSLCSSYLPDWRKNIDYRKNYSAKKEQGGGVSLDLIHEWDYIKYIFGKPLKVFNLKQKCSDLEISSEDLSIYIGQYKDKLVEVHLDYFGRKVTREIVMYTNEEVITGDMINYTIQHEGNIKKVVELDRVDIYVKEINHFLDCILLGNKNENNIMQAYETLEIALAGEKRE